MPDLRELLSNPDFRALPRGEQLKGLRETDADFGALPESEQIKALADPAFSRPAPPAIAPPARNTGPLSNPADPTSMRLPTALEAKRQNESEASAYIDSVIAKGVPQPPLAPGLAGPYVEPRPMSEQLLGGAATLGRGIAKGGLTFVGGIGGAIEAAGTGLESVVGKTAADRSAIPQLGQSLSKIGSYAEAAPLKPDAGVAGKSFLDDPSLLYQPDYILDLMGEGTGSTVASAAMPYFAAAAKGKKMLEAAKITGNLAKWAEKAIGIGAGSAVETITDAGNAYHEAIAAKATPQKAAELFVETMKRELPVTAAGNLAGIFNPATKGAWKAIVGALGEGLTEPGQGAAQRSAKNKVLGTNTPLLEGADVEALGGVLGGGAVGGGMAVADRVLAPKTVVKTPANYSASAVENTPAPVVAKPARKPRAKKATPAAATPAAAPAVEEKISAPVEAVATEPAPRPDVDELLADPEFLALPKAEQLKGIAETKAQTAEKKVKLLETEPAEPVAETAAPEVSPAPSESLGEAPIAPAIAAEGEIETKAPEIDDAPKNLRASKILREPEQAKLPADAEIEAVASSDTRAAAADNTPKIDTKLQPADATSEVGTTADIPVASIKVDPARFQFKANTGQGGAGEELRAVEKFDPELAGVVAVWRDPQDGETYVVNGHNRLALAARTQTKNLTVRHLTASSAAEARTKGALINIAEGRGESTDAAKVFRESGLDESDLKRAGISIKGKIASEGMALAKLDPHLFGQVISGDIPATRAAVIGAGLAEHKDQRALYEVIRARDKAGKRPTNDQIEEMIRLARSGPQKTETQESLFGAEEVTRSLIAEKAEVSDYIRKQLGSEKKLFGLVGSEAVAGKLGARGNVIKAQENQAVATKASQALAIYDKLSALAGPVSDALGTAASELADGKDATKTKQAAYLRVRQAIASQGDQLARVPQGSVRGSEGLDREGPLQAGKDNDAPADSQSELDRHPSLEVMRLRNGIAEGENILRAGVNALGGKLSKPQLAAVARSVENTKAKLEEQLKVEAVQWAERRKPDQFGDDIEFFKPRTALKTKAEPRHARATYRAPRGGRAGVVYANPDAMTIFEDALGQKFTAVHVPAPFAYHLMGRLLTYGESLEGEARKQVFFLRDTVRQAMLDHNSIAIVPEPKESIAESKAIVRHELMHRTQLSIGQGKYSRVIDAEKFLSHPAARRPIAELLKTGYANNPNVLAAEIAAHLAGGPEQWASIGITSATHAEILWDLYIDGLVEKSGDAVLERLTQVAPQLNGVLRDARQKAAEARNRQSVSRQGEAVPRGAQAQGQGRAARVDAGDPRGRSPNQSQAQDQIAASRFDEPDLFGGEFDTGLQRDAEAAAERKLEGARLTAQFKSGMQVKPGKKAKAAPQTSLFDETPEDEQGALFSLAGDHGPVFRQFRHDATGAIAKLREVKGGDAIAALHHPEIGDIDLIWGKSGDPANDFKGGYGLAHIDAKHPGIAEQLEQIIPTLVKGELIHDNRQLLIGGEYKAVVGLDWNEKAKRWLLTAYREESPRSEGSLGGSERASAEGPTTPSQGDDSSIAGNEKPVKPAVKRPDKGLLRDESGSARLDLGASKLLQPAKELASAARDFLLPAGTLIGKQGAAGAKLKTLIDRAFDKGEVAAGKRLVRLNDAGLDQLTREERFELLDSLQGEATPAIGSKVQIAHAAARAVLNEVAAETAALGVQVRIERTIWPGEGEDAAGFSDLNALQEARLDAGRPVTVRIKRGFIPREDYFPHVIRDASELKPGTLGRNQLRSDVIENLVRQDVRGTPEAAAAFLDNYIAWTETGERSQQLIDYVIASGQARSEADALAKLQRYRQRTIKRAGSLEFSRQVDLPFYDPDPARVLPSRIAQDTIRLAHIEHFGQENQRINSQINKIRKAGGDADLTRQAVDAVLKLVNEGNTPGERLSTALRAWQGFKLGLAAIPNMTQGSLNSFLASDALATVAGIRGLASNRGRRLGLESGAALESVISESMRQAGAGWQPLGVFLKATGFTATERFNRIIAANAGANYAGRLHARLRANPNDSRARSMLAELGIDPDTSALTADDVLMAAKKFSDLTQFRSRPQDLPLFASSPAGKVFFQFKTYIYGQTRLINKELIGELRAGRPGRAFRTLLILGIAFPIAGELVKDLRGWITGRERPDDLFKRYLEDISAVGATGVLGDLIEAGRYRRGVEALVGPTMGEAGWVIDTIASGKLGKAAFRRIPLVGPVMAQRLQEWGAFD